MPLPKSEADSGGGKTRRRARRAPNEIKELLMSAASAEFTENGFGGATTAAIARRADVTEAQLFRYFSSKVDLFQESVFKPLADHIRRFSELSLSSGDSSGNQALARVYIRELQQFLQQHSRMLMALLVARAYSPASKSDDGIDSLTEYFERGSEMMSRGMGQDATVDPRLTVRVSFAAVLACTLIGDWLFPLGLASRDDIDEAINVFIVNGITPLKRTMPATNE